MADHSLIPVWRTWDGAQLTLDADGPLSFTDNGALTPIMRKVLVSLGPVATLDRPLDSSTLLPKLVGHDNDQATQAKPLPPSIAVVSPTPGLVIAPTQELVLNVTAPGGLRDVFLIALFPSGPGESVYRPGGFLAPYLDSTTSTITNGLRFTIRRTGGWKASPTVEAHAVDAAGQGEA